MPAAPVSGLLVAVRAGSWMPLMIVLGSQSWNASYIFIGTRKFSGAYQKSLALGPPKLNPVITRAILAMVVLS